MNQKHFLATLALGFFLAVPATSFGQGKALIISPTDGATLDPLDELRKRKGDYLLETLSSGKRSLCVKVVNKAHVPIGIGQCIQVTVK
ncbi:MAG: hypothetical protein ABS89_08800 [Thiobacillus sp. SCN 63-1177]|nr:MAG: hypothetical protein ABS89_08800 [Thiobacillus sp. SCN 63-1177]